MKDMLFVAVTSCCRSTGRVVYSAIQWEWGCGFDALSMLRPEKPQRMLSKALQHYTKESSPVLMSFGRLVQEKTPCYKLFEIYRFNPDKDIKPHMERYAVDLSESLLSATSIVDVAECS